jgi:hypothetical protein
VRVALEGDDRGTGTETTTPLVLGSET